MEWFWRYFQLYRSWWWQRLKMDCAALISCFSARDESGEAKKGRKELILRFTSGWNWWLLINEKQLQLMGIMEWKYMSWRLSASSDFGVKWNWFCSMYMNEWILIDRCMLVRLRGNGAVLPVWSRFELNWNGLLVWGSSEVAGGDNCGQKLQVWAQDDSHGSCIGL